MRYQNFLDDSGNTLSRLSLIKLKNDLALKTGPFRFILDRGEMIRVYYSLFNERG